MTKTDDLLIPEHMKRIGGKKPDGSCNHSWLYFLNGPPFGGGYGWCVFCKKRDDQK